MTTKEFSNALGNISDHYVDEAITYTSKKQVKPWLKWGAMAACLALVLTVTLLSGAMDPLFQLIAPKESIEYSIYVGGGMLSSLKIEQAEAGLTADNSSLATAVKELPQDCDFEYFYSKTMETDNKSTEKQFIVAGQSYTLTYKETKANSLADSEIESLKQLGVINSYDTSEFTIQTTQSTDQLLFLSDGVIDRRIDGNFTEEDAEKAAKKLLTELYGDECLTYYENNLDVRPLVSDRYNLIIVEFCKKINGYNTSDHITIRYNRAGKVVAVNALKYGIFRSVANELTTTQIQAAQAKLTDYLDQCSYRYDEDSATLKINADGKCYLELFAQTPGGNWFEFYINVN